MGIFIPPLWLQAVRQAQESKRDAVAIALSEVKSAIEGSYPADSQRITHALRTLCETASHGAPVTDAIFQATQQRIDKLLETYPDFILERVEKSLDKLYEQAAKGRAAPHIMG